MKIEILGMGCQACTKLLDNTRAAAAELGLDADIRKVTDLQEIMKYGVMSTPALVVDGKVKAAGKVPGKAELLVLLRG